MEVQVAVAKANMYMTSDESATSWTWAHSLGSVRSRKKVIMGDAMITVSVRINRPSNVVWNYFTTIGNWGKWYGGALKQVTPAWQQGANLVWEKGGASPIIKFIPGSEIGVAGAGSDTTFQFSRESDSVTIVKLTESDPKVGAPSTDGGLGRKVELEGKLLNLRLFVEAETRIK
jgi:hypothetical protein